MKADRKYEDDIARSFEKGEWKPVKNLKKEMERFREAATETLLKNRRVNIRISAIDLEGLQAKAAAEGLPYQTLMASVLHKYVSGRLVEGSARITLRSGGRVIKRRAVLLQRLASQERYHSLALKKIALRYPFGYTKLHEHL